MAVLPPKRIVPQATQPEAAAPVPEAPASADPVTATAAESTASTPPAKKAAPVKTPKAAKPPAAKIVKAVKAAPAKATPAKAVPVKKVAPTKAAKKAPVKSSPRAATENVVPKVLKVKTRIWSDEAVELGVMIVDMKRIVPAITDKRIELRSVSDRLQVIFHEKLGISCRKVYSTMADVAKIVKHLGRVPEELMPAKWPTAIERIEKRIASIGA